MKKFIAILMLAATLSPAAHAVLNEGDKKPANDNNQHFLCIELQINNPTECQDYLKWHRIYQGLSQNQKKKVKPRTQTATVTQPVYSAPADSYYEDGSSTAR